LPWDKIIIGTLQSKSTIEVGGKEGEKEDFLNNNYGFGYPSRTLWQSLEPVNSRPFFKPKPSENEGEIRLFSLLDA
jgi:hypothetical protein